MDMAPFLDDPLAGQDDKKYCASPDHEGPNPVLLGEFNRNSGTLDGLQAWCRACFTSYRARCRDQVFAHYGRSCACCGATEDLTIDHVNGDGAAHRLELFGRDRHGTGWKFYRWLVDQGFPPGYQVMCKPCNSSKGDGPACRLDHSVDALDCLIKGRLPSMHAP